MRTFDKNPVFVPLQFALLSLFKLLFVYSLVSFLRNVVIVDPLLHLLFLVKEWSTVPLTQVATMRGIRASLPLLTLILNMYILPPTTRATVPAAQRSTLVDFYYSTNGPNWADNANWLSGDPCKDLWFGVTCAHRANITKMYVYYSYNVAVCRILLMMTANRAISDILGVLVCI